MGLKVSTLAPQPAPRLIDPGSFKPNFDLHVPGLDKETGDLVCGMVKQTLNLTANQNRLRTYTYNLMAKDDWKSAEFADLCNYAGGYCLSNYLKEKRSCQINDNDEQKRENFRHYLAAKVPEATALWMTTKIYDDPELESILGSSLYSKSAKLNKIYLESKRDIQAMSLDQNAILQALQLLGQNQNAAGLLAGLTGGNQMVNVNLNGQLVQMTQAQALQLQQLQQQQQQSQQGSAAAILAGLGQGGSNAGVLQALLGAAQNNLRPNPGETLTGVSAVIAASQPTSSSFNTAATVNTNQGDSSLMRNWKKSRGIDPDQHQTAADVSIGSPITEISASIPLGGAPVQNREPIAVAPALAPTPKPAVTISGVPEIKKLNIPGGSESAFSEQEPIFLGFRLPFKEETYKEFKSAVTRAIHEFPVSLDEDSLKEGESKYVTVDANIIQTSSVHDFINQARENKVFASFKNPEHADDLQISFGNICRSVYFASEGSKNFFDLVMDNLRSASKMRMTMEGAIAGVKSAGKEWTAAQTRMELSSLEQLDRWMTDQVNRFMAEFLNSNVSIESFTYDFNDLEKMVASKYSRQGSDALDEYMDTIMCGLREVRDETIRSVVEEEIDGIKKSAIIEQCAVMVLPYSTAQLGIYIVGRRNLIDYETNPILVDAIRVLEEQSGRAEIPVSGMYLVTNDDTIFRVNPSPLHKEVKGYIISNFAAR